MTDFDLEDVTVSGGTKPGILTASAQAGEAGKVWTGTFITAMGNSGNLEVTVRTNAARDSAGNRGPVRPARATAARDTTPPGVVAITLVPAVFNSAGDEIVATFTFSEVVTDFDLADVTVSGGTEPVGLTASMQADEAGKVWTGTFTTTGVSGDLEVTVRVDAARDSAGNTGPAAPISKIAVRDTTPPAVTFLPANGAAVNDPASNVTVRFDEDVRKAGGNAFDAPAAAAAVELKEAGSNTDLANGGTVSFSGRVITIDPANSLAAGEYTVTLLKDLVEDLQGNRIGSDQTATFTVDADAPTLEITLAPEAFRAGNDRIAARFAFSEVVTDFDLEDVTVSGGTKPGILTESAQAGEAGKVWTGTFITATVNSGNLEVTVRADAARDSAGNTGPAAPVSKIAVRDTTPPGVEITLAPWVFNSAGDEIVATFTFDEAVTGFDLTDIMVSGGTKPPGLTASTQAGKVWTGTFTATGNNYLEVTVRADAARDSAGNTGPTVAVAEFARYDAVAPARRTGRR